MLTGQSATQPTLVSYLKDFKTRLFADITEVPAILQGAHYPSLDGLRGIAILMVIIYHFGANHFFRPYYFLFSGELGVNIFFVISGFLITTLLLKEKLKYGNVSLKWFYTRRALRIIPVAYLFLLVMIVLNSIYKLGLSGSNFAASFLFYKNLPYQSDFYTGHFWSLAAEVQFYLITPALLLSSTNRYTIAAIFVVIAVTVISALGFYCPDMMHGNPAIHYITKASMYFFWNGPFIVLIGSLLAIFLFKGVINVNKTKGSYLLSFLLLIIVLVINNRLSLFYFKYASEFIATLLTAWIILLNLRTKNLLSVILESRVLVKIGVISYSLYIWQQLFIGSRSFLPWVKPFNDHPLGLFIVIKLISVFIIAFVSYYFFETRFLKIKNRYK